MTISYRWRDRFDNPEVNLLHAKGFDHPVTASDWWGRVNRHSLGWVCARSAGDLVGFVNVAWDGGRHAFILDTVVAHPVRRQGVGVALVAVAGAQARAAGCDWLHVDFEEQLGGFYLGGCGFRPTGAGLLVLGERD